MTTTLDPRLHAEAIKAALVTALGSAHAYDYDEVPGTNKNPGEIPTVFAEISIELTEPPGSSRRAAGQTSVRKWLGSVRGVGRSVDEARWVLNKAAEALYEQTLTVDGKDTEPLQFQAGQAPEWDDGRYSGWLTFTYGH